LRTLRFKLNGYTATLTDKMLRIDGDHCHGWEMNLIDLDLKNKSAATTLKPLTQDCLFYRSRGGFVLSGVPMCYAVWPRSRSIGCMQFTPKRWAELIRRTKLAQKKGKGGTK